MHSAAPSMGMPLACQPWRPLSTQRVASALVAHASYSLEAACLPARPIGLRGLGNFASPPIRAIIYAANTIDSGNPPSVVHTVRGGILKLHSLRQKSLVLAPAGNHFAEDVTSSFRTTEVSASATPATHSTPADPRYRRRRRSHHQRHYPPPCLALRHLPSGPRHQLQPAGIHSSLSPPPRQPRPSVRHRRQQRLIITTPRVPCHTLSADARRRDPGPGQRTRGGAHHNAAQRRPRTRR